jgi:hypothetical protein
MDPAVWVAIGAVLVSAITLIWQAADKGKDRKDAARQREAARDVARDEQKHRDLEADAQRERETRQEFAIGFVAWIGVMRDAIREPYLRRDMPESPDRELRLWGHAPKELWILHDQSPEAGQLIDAGEEFFRKWQGEGLRREGNYSMVRDAERLVAVVGRWGAIGALPDSFGTK